MLAALKAKQLDLSQLVKVPAKGRGQHPGGKEETSKVFKEK